MRNIDELRTPAAGRVLDIWRQCREEAGDPLERTLLCNARILAESCFFEGGPAFDGWEAVLSDLTGRQMEGLLRRLAGEDVPPSPPAGAVNPAFDQRRFDALRKE